jgi:hypothetical protein
LVANPVCRWPIVRLNNASPARDAEHYANTGAEIWFEGRRQIERQQIILPNDRELIAQLTSRLGWPDSKGRLQLESKADMRGRNLPSPDGADAVLGAMMPAYVPAKFEYERAASPPRRMSRHGAGAGRLLRPLADKGAVVLMKPEPRVEGCFEDVPRVSMSRDAHYIVPHWETFTATRVLTDAAIERYQRQGRYGRGLLRTPGGAPLGRVVWSG